MLRPIHSHANKPAAGQPFNGIVAMQEHLDQRKRVEDYVQGQSTNFPKVPTSCDGDCTVGKWLHSEGGRRCTDVKLVDVLCESCTEFRDAASHVVLLAQSGKLDLAKEALQEGRLYANASEEFQQHLVMFNCHYSAWAEGLL